MVLKEERVLVIHSLTNNPCRTRDSNPQPLDYKSNSLTIRPRLPSCSYFEANPAFIQRVFFQKRTVMLAARNDLALFVVGRLLGYLHMNARGPDRIRNNELDGTD